MCGIVGAVSPEPVDPTVVERMRDRLVHRGPDAAGLWLSPDAGVCLGHRRLAIVDLSPEANQPLQSHDGRFVITFNGEIYNFRGLRRQLEDRGCTLRTQSDTEVLVEAYRVWGPDCLERLSGMFAFAIWDAAERRLFCARDRLGEKPFHYMATGTCFVFASELKALVDWPGMTRRLDHAALVDFLALGFVADPRTVWAGCRKLPPGHSMTVRVDAAGNLRIDEPAPYWDMEFEPDTRVRDWSDEIRGTLERAAEEMSYADVPVGTFLSGGVDSSSVTAALSRAGCSVRTFTVGFDSEQFDERPFARTVAARYGTDHTERLLAADDVEPVLERLLWHYDEPFNDHSYLPTYYVCREARSAVTVALSGDGGDELFAGYTKYRRLALRSRLDETIGSRTTVLLAAGAARLAPSQTSLHRGFAEHRKDGATLLTEAMTPVFSPAALVAAARGPLSEALREYRPDDAVTRLVEKAPPREVGLVNTMRYLDLKLTLAGGILVKVDRASMACSLEVRPVYLHRDVVALAGRIPPRALVDAKVSKKALKAAFEPWLPQGILHRPKQGFAMPLAAWSDGGGGWLETVAGDGPLGELVDVPALAAAVGSGRPAVGDPTAARHSLFFLDRWLRRWAA
ncbi:MAG TPA: asparagine synthase (glutamine-hydrolyzing) [Candidatus Dormibacteraeota bacterium]|nr:asparagine synthase (glutamine-hydrolyzing) [Candidatus Dormibacteraeota bacterium]